MSYSFNIKALTKDAAKAAVAAKLDEMIAPGYQPIHHHDREQILANAAAVIDLLQEENHPRHANDEISVSCNGCLSWLTADDHVAAGSFQTASISATASWVRRAD